MEFTVIFFSTTKPDFIDFKGRSVPVFIEERPTAYHDVLYIRHLLGFKVPLNVINCYVHSLQNVNEFEVPEHVVSETEIFHAQQCVKVEVPFCWLNQFANLQLIKECLDSGEVESCGLKVSLDRDAVVEKWAELGFPTKIEDPNYNPQFYVYPPSVK